MDKLWAPWREKYLYQINKKVSTCVFCKILKEKKDKKNYIIQRKAYSYAVLNIYPYNNGHILIVTNRHVKSLSELKREEKEGLLNLVEEMQNLLDRTLKPEGYNVGMNIGKVAGAGFPGHLHIHIVPRWSGDVNFMPIVSRTKVLSQSLKKLYEILTHAKKK